MGMETKVEAIEDIVEVGQAQGHAVKGEDGGVRAYGIYIHAMGGEVYAPHDTDQVVRKATAAEATGPPPLRFKKGDRVLCNMGKERGLAPGKIEKVWVKRNPPPNAPEAWSLFWAVRAAHP